MKKLVASEILRIVGPEEAKIPSTHLDVRDTAYFRYTDAFMAGDIPDMADENDIR